MSVRKERGVVDASNLEAGTSISWMTKRRAS